MNIIEVIEAEVAPWRRGRLPKAISAVKKKAASQRAKAALRAAVLQIEPDAHEARAAGSSATVPMTSNAGTSSFPTEAAPLPAGGQPTLAYQSTLATSAFLSPTSESAGPGLWTSAALSIFGSPIIDRNYFLSLEALLDPDWGSIPAAPKRRGRPKKLPLVPPEATNDD
jgi:hypothetical protein